MNRRTFLTSTAVVAALSQTKLSGQPASLEVSKPPLLGVSNASLLSVRDITNATTTFPANKYQTIRDGNIQVALVPQAIENRAASDQKSQFILVQTVFNDAGIVVVKTPYGQEPAISGTIEKPDVALKSLTLNSFHVDQTSKLDPKSRGILRITTANKPSRGEDVLYWAITAGIDIYNQSKLKESEKSKVDQQLSSNLKGQPIQFLDGLGSIQVEVIKSKEPSWWKNLLHFFSTNPAVGALAASFGLPALGIQALGFIDELISKSSDASAEVLISSDIMPFAFSTRGRDKYKNNGARRIGVMNSGIWILIKPSDIAVLQKELPYYADSYGRLVPAKYSLPEEFLALVDKNPKEDPFYGITYAVLTAECVAHKFAIETVG